MAQHSSRPRMGVQSNAMKITAPRDRLVVALDLPDIDAARALVAQLGDSVSFYKIGYELGFSGGLGLAAELAGQGKQIFFDFKLHDIGNTVASGVRALIHAGASCLTVHAYPQTLRAAVEARGDSGVAILGVTVLTSWDEDDLRESGLSGSVAQTVRNRAVLTLQSGADGIICSANDLADLRSVLGDKLFYVTPGIRPKGTDSGDQKRVTTPLCARQAGATHLVVGRPITRTEDPRGMALRIIDELTWFEQQKD
jgi:orotidine-5'-phosphate decarboxylase